MSANFEIHRDTDALGALKFKIGDPVSIRNHTIDDLVQSNPRTSEQYCFSTHGTVFHLYGKGFNARAKCTECTYSESVSKFTA